MATRAFEKADETSGKESSRVEHGGALIGIVRAAQLGALFWIGIGLVIWAW